MTNAKTAAAQRFAGAAPAVLVLIFGLGALLVSALWAFAWRWRRPQILPAEWTMANWHAHAALLWTPALTTLIVGCVATALALLLTIGCLEAENRHQLKTGKPTLLLLYAPLLLPQAAFLFGAQTLLTLAGGNGSFAALVWGHLLFVLPYVYLSLSGPWRALDKRYEHIARCLGAGPLRTFIAVRLPMLLRAVLVAAAVGFAVSAGQYLATLFAGGGRFTTLTTEAVGLSAAGDRRLLGLFALLQSALPLAGFLLAAVIPAWLFRNRAGMRGWLDV